MTLHQEAFRADCEQWNGYKPCPIQKAAGLPNCVGCDQFRLGPSILDIEYQPFTPESLSEADRVGVVEMGGKGSILRTTAVTHALRQINPGVTISWFTHSKGADLLRYVPGVTAIDVERTNAATQQGVIEDLDVLLNFELGDSAKQVVRCAKRVGGFALNAQGKFHGVYPHAEELQRLQVDDEFRVQRRGTMQETLLKSIGLGNHEPRYDVLLRPDNYQEAELLLEDAFEGPRPLEIIGLNIGTSERGKARRWPAEHHAELAQKLADAYPDKGIVILSGPEDNKARAEVLERLGPPRANLAVLPNDLEIGDFMGVVSKCKLLVTSNTFALHVARSQGVPLISFENPLPRQEMELGPEDIQLSHNLSCGPCYNRCNQPVFAQCMREISADEVLSQAVRMLSIASAT